MTDPDVAAAWEAVWAALERLRGWEASRPSWHASAYYAGHLRRTDPRPAVDARGATEAEALRELAELREAVERE